MLDLLTISFVFLTLIGVALLLRGWRGRRVDDHPWCRRCRFDLQGRWPGAEACPECGAALHAIGAVEVGQRKRRWITLVIGLLILVGCGVWVIRSGPRSWQRFNWMSYKPDWWVIHDAHSTDDAAADAALRELTNRIHTGALSNGQVSGLVAEGLKRQADENTPWRSGWGDVIQLAWDAGLVSSDQILQYAQRAVDVKMVVDTPIVRRWEFCQVGIQQAPLRAGRNALTLDFGVGATTLGGIDHGLDRQESAKYRTVSATGIPVIGTSFAVLAEPGEHELKITWHASLRAPSSAAAPPEWDVTLTAPLTVLQPTANAQELITDPQVSAAIREHIEMRAIGLRVPPEFGGGPPRFSQALVGRIVVVLTFRDAPMACNLNFKAADQPPFTGMYGTGRMGLSAVRGSSYRAHLFVRLPTGTEPDQIGVIINPGAPHTPGIGLARPGTEQIWYGKAIEIDGIPVTWYDTADDPAVPEEWRPILYEREGVRLLPPSSKEGESPASPAAQP